MGALKPNKRRIEKKIRLIQNEFGLEILHLETCFNKSTNLYLSQCQFHLSNRKIRGNDIVITASGVDQTKSISMLKCLSECLERYAGASIFESEIKYTSWRQLKDLGVHPHVFPRYSGYQYEDKNFPFSMFSEDTIIGWELLKDTKTNKQMFIPACLVQVPYVFQTKKKEQVIFQPISTGMACHSNLKKAILNGILEVLERDSLAIVWQGTMSPPKIDFDSLPLELGRFIKSFEKENTKLHLLDIRLDHLIPVIMAVSITDDGVSVPVMVGSAAHINVEIAIKKAVSELMISRNAYEKLSAQEDRNMVSNSFVDQMHYWADPDRLDDVGFLLKNVSQIKYHELEDYSHWDLHDLIQAVNKRGHNIYVKNFDNERLLKCGLFGVKVVIPGMIPISSGYQNRYTYGKRFNVVLNKEISEELPWDNQIPSPFL